MMDHQELVGKFSQTVGIEKAEALIAAALADLGIERRESYSHHEVVDICETIQQASEGYVRLVANEIRVDEQAQRRFDALLDEIRDPIVTVSFEDSTPIVTAMNPTFEETFGCDASAIGDPLPDLIGTDDCDDPMDRWRRSDREGSVELRCRTADGRRRTFLFRSVVVMRERGDVEGYGIYTDITERKRRERELELQNEQLDRFASVVSHDLRTPLSIASGHLELARERASDDAVRDHLRTIGEAHDRMNDLIEDLLTLARQGRIVDAPEPVSVADVVHEAWASVSTDGASLQIEDDLAVSIEADRPRLRQLLENLFRNAVEHGSTNRSAADAPASERGADGDEGTTVRVGWLPDQRGLYVADDGPGIATEDRDCVFEHGFSTRSDGTGFGLAIVEAIAEAHEWSVSVTDSWAGGARFEVTGISVGDSP